MPPFNSIVLFGSGVTMHYALEHWKHANRRRFNLFMGLTILLGAGFLCGQGYEYAHAQIGGWNGSIFGASFFTLTGMHGLHVFIGVCFLIALWIQTTRGVYDAPSLLRPHRRHAVLALRRRDLGRTLLLVLSVVGAVMNTARGRTCR